MGIGKRIKKLRIDKEITQEELGKIIGVSTSMVGMYERNARKPSYDVLIRIADYFEVSVDYLLGRVSDTKGLKSVKTVKTADLIRELENRPGIEKIFVGSYQPYELKRKYSNDRTELTPDFVLVVNGQQLL